MSFTYRYRKLIMVIIVLLLTISGGGFYAYKNNFKKEKVVTKDKVLLTSKKTPKVAKVDSKKEEIIYQVDIKGEIVNPGLYSLKEGSRVSDVINMAGGLTEKGDTSVINLSKKITDEMVIIIYSKWEVENFKETKEVEKQVIDNCINNADNIKNDACIDKDEEEEKTDNEIISINTATVEELQNLSGVGEAKAKNIILYRNEHGQFKDINELKNVQGIGDAIFDQIKDHITL